MRRTGRRRQDTAAFEALDAAARQFAVSPNRAGTLRLALCQRWRIKNDQIESAFRTLLDPFKGVGVNHLVATRPDTGQVTIQGKVTLCPGQRGSADVQVRDGTGAAPRRVNGEAARKAERVQHVAMLRERFNGAAVFALIEKETGLLPEHDIGLKTQSAFQETNTGITPVSDDPLSVRKIELCQRRFFDVTAETQHQPAGSVLLAETARRSSRRRRR